MVRTVGNSASEYPFSDIRQLRTDTAVTGAYRPIVLNVGSAWLSGSAISRISFNRFGRSSSAFLRPLSEKLSLTAPCPISCVPLRIVLRFQPKIRYAPRCPPFPNALTIFAMNIRQSQPLSFSAVSVSTDFNDIRTTSISFFTSLSE